MATNMCQNDGITHFAIQQVGRLLIESGQYQPSVMTMIIRNQRSISWGPIVFSGNQLVIVTKWCCRPNTGHIHNGTLSAMRWSRRDVFPTLTHHPMI